MAFVKATKHQLKLRMALIGPSGSGKTYSALEIAKFLGARVALLDTEHQSARKYADLFDFDTMEIDNYHPQNYINAIKEAEAAGYEVMIIDSMTHAWTGKDGALELVDKFSKKYSGNKHAAWGDVTPIQTDMIETILASKMHIIATMRSKMDYVQEKDAQNRTIIRKVGMAPIQRDGLEYEFDLIGEMTTENDFIVSKTRCSALTGYIVNKPGKDVADILLNWLNTGVQAPAPPVTAPAAQAPPPQQPAPRPTPPAVAPAQQTQQQGSADPNMLSEPQVKYIHILGSKKFSKQGEEQFRVFMADIVGRRCSTKLLTKKEASDVIEQLQILPDYVEPEDPTQTKLFEDPAAATQEQPTPEVQQAAAAEPTAQKGDPDYDPFTDPNIGSIEPDPGEYCDTCKTAIVGTTWGGKSLNALEFVKMCLDQSGKKLCPHCLSSHLTAAAKEKKKSTGRSQSKAA